MSATIKYAGIVTVERVGSGYGGMPWETPYVDLRLESGELVRYQSDLAYDYDVGQRLEVVLRYRAADSMRRSRVWRIYSARVRGATA